jgi:1,4-dihydroxy-2-naphthoate octaprenyltransferase
VALAQGAVRLDFALAALFVALSLQVGVNFANDYSDGVRGTDQKRVGPQRLVGSGLVPPRRVLAAAVLSLALAGIVGLGLAYGRHSWALIIVGAFCLLAAAGYTGGPFPYGYYGFGELMVFLCFGLVAVVGTTYVEIGRVVPESFLAAAGPGLAAAALLAVNNLRDEEGDRRAGKKTLAVRLGATRGRQLYIALLAGSLLSVVGLALWRPGALLGEAAAPLAYRAIKNSSLAGSPGAMISALVDTGRMLAVIGIGVGAGLYLWR